MLQNRSTFAPGPTATAATATGEMSTLQRTVLKNVYLWMASGLAVTGLTSTYVASNDAIVGALAQTPMLLFGLIIAELGLVFYLSARIHKMTPAAISAAFMGYALLNGVTLSLVFLAYTGASIARAFFLAGGMFAAMSVYAVTTKRNLASWGSYLFMGLIGIILASVVNIFLASAALDWLISLVGVGIFLGLTAYDTQRILALTDQAAAGMNETRYIQLSAMGALRLYLDFINLFLFLLRLLGGRD
ncbi:MAG: Bax inhibitor-1/YccA family protein [Spirochaetota bacterium]